MGASGGQVSRQAGHFGGVRNAGVQDRAGAIGGEGERKDALTHSSHMREDASGKTMSVLRHVCTAASCGGGCAGEGSFRNHGGG